MGKILDKIVQDDAAPSRSDLWLDGETLKANIHGKWKSISGGGSGAGVTIVDSVDKLDKNAPVGTPAVVAVGGGIKETKFSKVFETLPDLPTTEDEEVMTEYLNALPIVSKINIVAPRVIPEDAEYVIIFFTGDIKAILGQGEGTVIMIDIQKSGAQAMFKSPQVEQKTFNLFMYDTVSQTYVLNIQQINELNAIFASDDFKYLGDFLGSILGPMSPEDLIVIDTFMSLYVGTKSQTQLYIKEEEWTKVAERDIQKIYKELENKISIPRLDAGYTLYTGNVAEQNVFYRVSLLEEPIIKLDIDTSISSAQYKEFIFYFPGNNETDIQFLDKNGIPLEIKWANGNSPIFEKGGNYFVSIVCGPVDYYLGVFVEFI